MEHEHDHDHLHHHDHPPTEITHDLRPGYYEIMETAVRELLIEKKMFGASEIRKQIEVLDSRTPALGARVVAQEQLAALVTRDTMIGVVPATKAGAIQ
jgi:nitrile hydratase